MPYNVDQQINTGSFIPTTAIFELGQQIQETNVNNPQFKELIVRLVQVVNEIALALNTKDSAFYLLEEFATGQLYFNPASTSQLDLRPGFRKEVNTGQLNAGVNTIPHGLVPDLNWKWTKILGAASHPDALPANARYYPLPFAGGVNSIELYLTGTSVVITNNSGVVFESSMVTLEYVKL